AARWVADRLCLVGHPPLTSPEGNRWPLGVLEARLRLALVTPRPYRRPLRGRQRVLRPSNAPALHRRSTSFPGWHLSLDLAPVIVLLFNAPFGPQICQPIFFFQKREAAINPAVRHRRARPGRIPSSGEPSVVRCPAQRPLLSWSDR